PITRSTWPNIIRSDMSRGSAGWTRQRWPKSRVEMPPGCSASMSKAQARSMRAGRLEPRLLERMRCRESRHLEAPVGEASHRRKRAQFQFEKMRAHHLPRDADVCEARLG